MKAKCIMVGGEEFRPECSREDNIDSGCTP